MRPFKNLLGVLVLLMSLLLMTACSTAKETTPMDLLNTTLTFDVYGCKTVFVNVSGIDQNTPIKDCGDFTAANHRLPQGNESGAGNTQKIGQVRVRIDGDKKGINDIFFGVDSQFGQRPTTHVQGTPPATTFNGLFLPIVETLPSMQSDTSTLHSLRTVLHEQGHTDFALDTSPFGKFPLSSATYVSSFGPDFINIDLVLYIPETPDPSWDPTWGPAPTIDAKYQMVRFHFENNGNGVVFSPQVMMKYAPNGNTVPAAKGPIEKAGGSVDIVYYATTISADNDFDGTNEDFLTSYVTIGGPEFRFVSSSP